MKNKINEKRRFGKFKLSRFCLESEDYEQLRELFRNFIIVRAENLFVENVVEYTAISHLFDSLNEGEVIPEYRIEVSFSNGYISKVNAVRLDD